MTTTAVPPAAADTAPTPADRLRAAADYLHTRGWHQGGYYDPTADAAYPPACTAGAIMLAASTTGFRPDHDLGDLFHPTPGARAALYLLAAYLIEATGCDDAEDAGTYGNAETVVTTWNDDPDRTPAEVTAALHAAADDWDRIHRAARAALDADPASASVH
jgi:hypothetical protein